MKKPFNLRFPVLYALSLICGIVVSSVIAYFGGDGCWLLLPAGVLFAACALYGVISKRAARTFAYLLAACFFTVGAVYTYCLYCSFIQTPVNLDGELDVCGAVSEVGITSGGKRYIVLENLTLGGQKVKGKLIAFLGERAGDYCRRGYDVTFYTKVYKESFISDGNIGYRAAQDIRYYCTVVGGMKAHYNFSLFGEVNHAVENALYNNVGGETASVCFALLTGTTDFISEGTLSSFRNGGLAHVFAVSGLHIGVIYGALTAIFKKSGVNRFISAAVRIVFIFLYAGVCGFSPSSLRAVIMCAVSAISSCIYCRYDSLNALSVAAIIILLVNPMQLFEVGFVLSFSALCGIVLLSGTVRRLFRFLPEKIKGALSVGLPAQFATVPALMNSFGCVSWAGLFLNLIFVPVISALYVLLFAGVLLSLILPFAAAAIIPAVCVPIEFIINAITACGFENAVLYGVYGKWIYLPFIVVTLAFSDKLNARLGLRGIVAFLTVALTFVAVTARPQGSAVTVRFGAGMQGGYALISTKDGDILVVSQGATYLPDSVCREAEVLVIAGGDYSLSSLFATEGDFDCVYVRGSVVNLPSLGKYELIYADSFSYSGADFCFDGDALRITAGGVEFAVALDGQGNPYGGAVPTGCDYCLYCYGTDGAVLISRGEEYPLTVCGAIRYVFSYGRAFAAFAVTG